MSIGTVQTEKILSEAPGATDWVRIKDKLAVQITGTATDVTILVERSTRAPDDPAGLNTAVVDTLTGNPATGLAPAGFDEPGLAWWRARATGITGGEVTIAISSLWRG